jgi:hypothetical protein
VISDATPLDGGGISYSVWTADGIRVARQSCP